MNRRTPRKHFLGRGPNGRRICYCGCGQEVPKGRHTLASDECQARVSPAIMRHRVYLRDHGVCAKCGFDSVRAVREIWDAKALSYAEGKLAIQRLSDAGYNHWRHLWEADHIVEICNGGDSVLENMQTLCTKCHKEKTKALARQRAESRRALGIMIL